MIAQQEPRKFRSWDIVSRVQVLHLNGPTQIRITITHGLITIYEKSNLSIGLCPYTGKSVEQMGPVYSRNGICMYEYKYKD